MPRWFLTTVAEQILCKRLAADKWISETLGPMSWRSAGEIVSKFVSIAFQIVQFYRDFGCNMRGFMK